MNFALGPRRVALPRSLFVLWGGIVVSLLLWHAVSTQLGGPLAIYAAVLSSLPLAGAFHWILRQSIRASSDFEIAETRSSHIDFQRIVKATHEGIWVTDADNKTSYVNPRLTEMLGYQPHELIGRTPADLAPDAATRTRVANNLARRKQGITDQYDMQYVR